MDLSSVCSIPGSQRWVGKGPTVQLLSLLWLLRRELLTGKTGQPQCPPSY